jgi:hypothetical protein
MPKLIEIIGGGATSALPLIADICSSDREVGLGPKADIAPMPELTELSQASGTLRRLAGCLR